MMNNPTATNSITVQGPTLSVGAHVYAEEAEAEGSQLQVPPVPTDPRVLNSQHWMGPDSSAGYQIQTKYKILPQEKNTTPMNH